MKKRQAKYIDATSTLGLIADQKFKQNFMKPIPKGESCKWIVGEE